MKLQIDDYKLCGNPSWFMYVLQHDKHLNKVTYIPSQISFQSALIDDSEHRFLFPIQVHYDSTMIVI
jgi:hypothetical protein